GLVRRHTDEPQMKAVEQQLEARPDAALAYAYHSIYNIAGFTLDRYEELRRRSDDRKADGELGRVAEFATRMMRRYPRAAIDGAFAVRVAEADLELGDDASAERLARQALRMKVKGGIRAEALWVEGVAQDRQGEQKAARDMLTRLVAENPNNRYTEGARANLAMLLEDMGDLNGPLEQYLAKGYRFGAA